MFIFKEEECFGVHLCEEYEDLSFHSTKLLFLVLKRRLFVTVGQLNTQKRRKGPCYPIKTDMNTHDWMVGSRVRKLSTETTTKRKVGKLTIRTLIRLYLCPSQFLCPETGGFHYCFWGKVILGIFSLLTKVLGMGWQDIRSSIIKRDESGILLQIKVPFVR